MDNIDIHTDATVKAALHSSYNIDKQMTDSRGDVAYLMADVSNVGAEELKGLWVRLEELEAKIRTRILY